MWVRVEGVVFALKERFLMLRDKAFQVAILGFLSP
jgi:hypothetical protein